MLHRPVARLRLAVAGPSGTGKTTLCAALNRSSGIAVAREAARELGELGLALSEHSGGGELAAIALVQRANERAVAGAGKPFVCDRSALDIFAHAQEISLRGGPSELDLKLAESAAEFARFWLAEDPYTAAVLCSHEFVRRPIESSFQERLREGYRKALAVFGGEVIRLEEPHDYTALLERLGAAP